VLSIISFIKAEGLLVCMGKAAECWSRGIRCYICFAPLNYPTTTLIKGMSLFRTLFTSITRHSSTIFMHRAPAAMVIRPIATEVTINTPRDPNTVCMTLWVRAWYRCMANVLSYPTTTIGELLTLLQISKSISRKNDCGVMLC
jgi:hypothetical protein